MKKMSIPFIVSTIVIMFIFAACTNERKQSEYGEYFETDAFGRSKEVKADSSTAISVMDSSQAGKFQHDSTGFIM